MSTCLYAVALFEGQYCFELSFCASPGVADGLESEMINEFVVGSLRD